MMDLGELKMQNFDERTFRRKKDAEELSCGFED